MKKKLKAFSILEITISLGIIGIILNCIIMLWFTFSKHQIKKLNNQKYEYIKLSMQNFLIQHGRLPNASSNENGNEEKITCGYLPYRTLGIDKKYMFDSNKNKFKYIVNEHFTKTNIPLVRPLSFPPKNGETSFLRIYEYNQDEIIKYDKIAHTKENLQIIENNESVISDKDFFYILPPLKKFKTFSELNNWIKNSKEDEKYKTANTIAWILISFKDKNKINQENTKVFHKNKDTIFYQSRFDMAAQTEFNATPEPIYEE